MPRSTITLYRPTGPAELALLEENGFTRWPPRLPGQPIFYPVTNEQYAVEVATRWNVRDSGSGYVTRFEVDAEFMARYEVRAVEGKDHTEWQIPAEELDDLNDHIVGKIAVIHRFE